MSLIPTMSHARTRVGVVTREEILLEGLATVVERDPSLEFAGGWIDVGRALGAWINIPPDVVVVGQDEGLQLTRAGFHSNAPALVVLASPGADATLSELISAGVRAVIDKSAPADIVMYTVRLVARGHRVLGEAIAPGLLRRIERVAGTSVLGKLSITARESEVLEDIAHGYSNQEIAARRHMSVGTVKVHLRSIRTKAGVETRAALVGVAVRSVLLL